MTWRPRIRRNAHTMVGTREFQWSRLGVCLHSVKEIRFTGILTTASSMHRIVTKEWTVWPSEIKKRRWRWEIGKNFMTNLDRRGTKFGAYTHTRSEVYTIGFLIFIFIFFWITQSTKNRIEIRSSKSNFIGKCMRNVIKKQALFDCVSLCGSCQPLLLVSLDRLTWSFGNNILGPVYRRISDRVHAPCHNFKRNLRSVNSRSDSCGVVLWCRISDASMGRYVSLYSV